MFTDDDCTFDEDAIASFAEGLAANPGAIVGGRTINALPGNPFASASQAIVDAVYAYNNPDPADARFFASNNMAAERSAILACGGFDERFTGAAEDRELCDRWRHRGGRLVYRPEAIVYHAHDLRLGSFVRQHHAYGRGAYTYHRVRAARGSGRMRDDLRFHAELPARLLAAARARAGRAPPPAGPRWPSSGRPSTPPDGPRRRSPTPRSEPRSVCRAAGPAARPLALHRHEKQPRLTALEPSRTVVA